jgi:hypothetical protein
MAFLKPEKFSRDINKVLFTDEEFVTKAKRDQSADAVTFHYNEAAELADAETGQPVLPLSITETEYGQRSYDSEQIYAGPHLIRNENEMLTNIDIYQDQRDQVAQILSRKYGNIAAHNWGPTDKNRIFLTTGLDEAGGSTKTRTTTLTGSATGERKRIGLLDLLQVKRQLQKDGDVGGQMMALITPDMLDDLYLIPEFRDYEKTGSPSPLVKGAIIRALGFNIMTRWDERYGSVGLHYNQSKTKKDNATASIAANDGAAALFWKTNAVRYGKTPIETSIRRKSENPEYLGATIFSSYHRFGATISRGDQKGVVALVEATTS